MKVIGVACSCLARSNSLKAVEAFLKGAAEAGHETELIRLDRDLRGCIGCQACKKEGAGLCVQKDVLTGFKVIKSFKAEESISNLHEQKNKDVADATNQRAKASVLVNYSSMLSSSIVQFGVFFVAAALALSGKGFTVGTVLVFTQLMNYLLGPIQLFPNFFAGRQSALRLMEKLAAALNQNISDEGEHIAPQLTEGIAIRSLQFAYEENKPVLNGIDMQIAAGGCYALVGGSGSGKSTILNLLMAGSRDYGGEILYDGKELKTVSPSSLYDLVSITAPYATISPCSPSSPRRTWTER